MKVTKAIEISDAKIQYISLVDKAANKRRFLITKAEGGEAEFSVAGRILKVDNTAHYLTGIVYEPLVEDVHGNFMTEDEIKKAAYWFAKNSDKVDLQHSFEKADGVSVVENYVAPCDMKIDETPVTKGTWLMTAEVANTEVWNKVKKGEVTGFSMGGSGRYSETDVDISDVSKAAEKKNVFKSFAKLFGFDIVEKPRDDEVTINDIQKMVDTASDNIEKALKNNGAAEKEGNKIAGTTPEKFNAVREVFTELKNNLSDEEVTEVSKTEIQKMIDEAIAEAVAEAVAKAIAERTESAAAAVADEVITKGAILKMVDEAVAKATAVKTETCDSSADIAALISASVTKAVEPLLRARGLPSNLNGEQIIEKSGGHYLAGIL